MTLDEVLKAAKTSAINSKPKEESRFSRLWPSDFGNFDSETAFEFLSLCRTWDEAGRQVRKFPEKDYLKLICHEWIECRKNGQPLIIEKSRRLVTSWCLRALELFDGGFARGNQLITHTKRSDAAGHVWRIFFMYDDLRYRYPSWNLPPALTYGNELTQELDLLVLPNETKIGQYFEQPKGLQGSGFSIVTMEELSIYRSPAGMFDQAKMLVQSPPGMPNGLIVGITNYNFADSYELIIKGASSSPY